MHDIRGGAVVLGVSAGIRRRIQERFRTSFDIRQPHPPYQEVTLNKLEDRQWTKWNTTGMTYGAIEAAATHKVGLLFPKTWSVNLPFTMA